LFSKSHGSLMPSSQIPSHAPELLLPCCPVPLPSLISWSEDPHPWKILHSPKLNSGGIFVHLQQPTPKILFFLGELKESNL
jgi:hypothetical protein